MTNETVPEIRDRLFPTVRAYAQNEGLTYDGAIMAALRFGIIAGLESARLEEEAFSGLFKRVERS